MDYLNHDYQKLKSKIDNEGSKCSFLLDEIRVVSIIAPFWMMNNFAGENIFRRAPRIFIGQERFSEARA